MENSSQEKKVLKSKKEQIKELRHNIEALLFHIIIAIVLAASLNIGLKSIGFDLLGKLPTRIESIANYTVGVSALIFGYWYFSHRILLENAK